MNKEDEEDAGLEKFVKYNVDELRTLRESYEVKIKSRVENHWLTKLESKWKKDLYNQLMRIALGLMLVSLLCVFGIIVFTIFDKEIFLKYFNWIFYPLMIMMMGGGVLLQSLDDRTGKWRKDLRNIGLILDKKQPNFGKKIMIDSNIFDDIISGKINRVDIENAKKKDYKFYITHIQVDEINDCREDDKRKKLNLFIATTAPSVVPTESTVSGLSRVGFSKLSDGELVNSIKGRLPNIKKSKDALIAETAIKNDYILLSNDIRLRKAVHRVGGRAISLSEFLKQLS